MSQKLKPIKGKPLTAFCLRGLMAFGKKWPAKQDFEKIALQFGPNGYPIIGADETLQTLFRAAVFPEQLADDPEAQNFFFVIYHRAPDFVLGLLTYLRKQFKALKPPKRAILFSSNNDLGAKAMLDTIKASVGVDAVKVERQRVRAQVDDVAKLHAEAKLDLEAKFVRLNGGRKFTTIIETRRPRKQRNR